MSDCVGRKLGILRTAIVSTGGWIGAHKPPLPANGCTGARSLSNNLISRNSRSAQSACEPCKGRHYSPAGAYSRQFAFRRGLKDVRLESVMRSIVLQNSQNSVGSISRKSTKQTAIAERCSLQAITEVARESPLDNLVPQMIIRSPRVRPGKPVSARILVVMPPFERPIAWL